MKFFAVATFVGLINAVALERHHHHQHQFVQTTGDYFEAKDIGTGPLDKKYERVLPAYLSGSDDDLFMKSVISSYASELKTEEGLPTGQFFMTEASTRAIASSVLSQHKGMKGAELESYLKTYFPRTWNHYDVNKTGYIAAEVTPLVMRFLASDQQLSLQWSPTAL